MPLCQLVLPQWLASVSDGWAVLVLVPVPVLARASWWVWLAPTLPALGQVRASSGRVERSS